MAGPRGYSSYRGRVSKLKVALAVVLVLVILAAGAVIYLQRYVVYDEEGRPMLMAPWQGEDEPPLTGQTPSTQPEDPVVIIQDPVEPPPDETPEAVEIRAFSLPAEALTAASWEAALAAKPETCNAVSLTMKDDSGRIYFDTAGAVSSKSLKTEADTAAALAAVTAQEELYTIARLGCLHDSQAANADVEGMGLKNTGGYIFYDKHNTQWLDASKPGTREYLSAFAKELAALGFDEILLTSVSYPTEGKLNKVAYGEIPKEDNLAGLAEALHAALEGTDTKLSIEVPQAVITEGRDELSGLDLAKLAPHIDRVYAEATAENVETLRAAVGAVSETISFVPELAADGPTITGNRLFTAS